MENYNLKTFYEDCFKFNSIAGKLSKTKLSDLLNQSDLIDEELQELYQGLSYRNAEEILDAVIDLEVVVFGFAQKLEAMGFNVNLARKKTAENNLSKFVSDPRDIVEDLQKNPTWKCKFNNHYTKYVLLDEKDKVRKPSTFVKNDLKDCIPEMFKGEGFAKATE